MRYVAVLVAAIFCAYVAILYGVTEAMIHYGAKHHVVHAMDP